MLVLLHLHGRCEGWGEKEIEIEIEKEKVRGCFHKQSHNSQKAGRVLSRGLVKYREKECAFSTDLFRIFLFPIAWMGRIAGQ